MRAQRLDAKRTPARPLPAEGRPFRARDRNVAPTRVQARTSLHACAHGCTPLHGSARRCTPLHGNARHCLTRPLAATKRGAGYQPACRVWTSSVQCVPRLACPAVRCVQKGIRRTAHGWTSHPWHKCPNSRDELIVRPPPALLRCAYFQRPHPPGKAGSRPARRQADSRLAVFKSIHQGSDSRGGASCRAMLFRIGRNPSEGVKELRGRGALRQRSGQAGQAPRGRAIFPHLLRGWSDFFTASNALRAMARVDAAGGEN